MIKMSKEEKRKIDEFLTKYPPLDEYELEQRVKEQLPTDNIVRTYCKVISSHWQELRKSNLLVWDINIYLESIGFVGTNYEKYYLGLILDHIYREYSNAHELNKFLDRVVEYLADRKTYEALIEMVKKANFTKKMNIPYDVLWNMAQTDVGELEKLMKKARLKR